jgi:hypothetical protein
LRSDDERRQRLCAINHFQIPRAVHPHTQRPFYKAASSSDTMDFDETRLYYSHQQLHQRPLTVDGDGDAAPGGQQIRDDNDDDEENSVPTAAMRRHFREFFRTSRVAILLHGHGDHFSQFAFAPTL